MTASKYWRSSYKMQSLTIEYEGSSITLARPKLSDGQVRRKIWKALEVYEGERSGSADVFAYVVTQMTAYTLPDSPDYRIPRLLVYPGDEAVIAAYDEWCQEIDEAFSNTLSRNIIDLNG